MNTYILSLNHTHTTHMHTHTRACTHTHTHRVQLTFYTAQRRTLPSAYQSRQHQPWLIHCTVFQDCTCGYTQQAYFLINEHLVHVLLIKAHHKSNCFVEMYALLGTIGLLVGLILLRFIYLASKCGRDTTPISKRTSPGRTLIVLGSGGHTAEMLRLLGGMNLKNYTPRVYVVAEGDKMSVNKAEKFESTASAGFEPAVSIRMVPRARQVMQSYVTSIFSTLVAVVYSLPIVWSAYPDLVLCNGPGTCIPVCFWAYTIKFFGLTASKIIYVESVCRVERLSLSGLLMYYLCMADCVFVQWPQLKQKYPKTSYIGRIV